ncbi:chitin deacetylase [Crassisporium funariophilum]|nr:chitin deacetylase [Crassisporium funariophilum]
MMLKSLLCTLALAAGFVSAAPSQLATRAPAQVITKCTVPNTAALTFDDGPYVYLYDVSKALIAAGAKGTFFFNGKNFGDCIYTVDQAKRVKYAFDKGHQVASHTWRHAHLTNLTSDQVHHEFWLVEEALMKITGAYPAFVRPPYGEYNDMVREVAGIRGQTIANWDFDSGDTWGIPTAQVNQRYTDIAKARPSTILTLNHDVHQQTAQVVVPHAIKTLQAAGYRLVTVAECLGMAPYQWVAAPQARDASWTCDGK